MVGDPCYVIIPACYCSCDYATMEYPECCRYRARPEPTPAPEPAPKVEREPKPPAKPAPVLKPVAARHFRVFKSGRQNLGLRNFRRCK